MSTAGVSTTGVSGPGRRTFGPVLMVGLASGALAAVAGARDWAVGSADRLSSTDTEIVGVGIGQMPLAAALALVVLACWGALLVLRGVTRRVVAGLAALASAGMVITCAVAWTSVPANLTDTLAAATGGAPVEVSWTGWYPAAWVAALLSLTATVAAVRLVPTWPEMGRRYDRATSAPVQAADGEDDRGNLELWKALDEGHDPTDPGTGGRAP